MDNPIIEYCYATGDVDGDGSVGGLAGENLNLISNSYATGAVHGTNSVAYQMGIGGLVGEQVDDGDELGCGVYFYKLHYDNNEICRKIVKVE